MTTKLSPTQKIANERVRKGAALLDKDHKGWHREIQDIADVNMQDPNTCILGHVFGDFWDGLNIIFPMDSAGESEDTTGVLHGFNVRDADNEVTGVRFEHLHKAWEYEIIKRARKDKDNFDPTDAEMARQNPLSL